MRPQRQENVPSIRSASAWTPTTAGRRALSVPASSPRPSRRTCTSAWKRAATWWTSPATSGLSRRRSRVRSPAGPAKLSAHTPRLRGALFLRQHEARKRPAQGSAHGASFRGGRNAPINSTNCECSTRSVPSFHGLKSSGERREGRERKERRRTARDARDRTMSASGSTRYSLSRAARRLLDRNGGGNEVRHRIVRSA